MKLKVAILDNDINYLDRLTSTFNSKYADKLEVYSFTEKEKVIETLKKVRMDVLLTTTQFEIKDEELRGRCGMAYFVDPPGIESVKEKPAICKFQKAELIYKQILSVYSDMESNISNMKSFGDAAAVIMFTSPCGGTGTSVTAAACAVAHARLGKKVFYLNLETFGVTDSFFTAEGQFTMSDVIYSIKSRKTNISLKLESCIKQSQEGVKYFASPKVALDMIEMTDEDIEVLIKNIQITEGFDEVIVDIPFSLDRDKINLLSKADRIVMVNDGSQIANEKYMKAIQALNLIEQNGDIDIISKSCMIYNKFSNKSSVMLNDIPVNVIGGAPKYEQATTKQLIEQLSKMNHYNTILS
ncbi:AAA family ATPase [Agathobacter sp.]|uniref:AAA family ATPase n=1 Tax=Agathobacter sp. TaxID=2021311 RepID=UPI003AB64DA6